MVDAAWAAVTANVDTDLETAHEPVGIATNVMITRLQTARIIESEVGKENIDEWARANSVKMDQEMGTQEREALTQPRKSRRR